MVRAAQASPDSAFCLDGGVYVYTFDSGAIKTIQNDATMDGGLIKRVWYKTLFTCSIFLAQKRLKKHHISEDRQCAVVLLEQHDSPQKRRTSSAPDHTSVPFRCVVHA